MTIKPASTNSMPYRFEVCGVQISVLDQDTAPAFLVEAALAGAGLQVHLCNAYTLSLVPKDEMLRAALSEADLNLADGTPVAWLGRKNGLTGPVRGPSLFRSVVALGAQGQLRHYVYGGGSTDVARDLIVEMLTAVPHAEFVGVEAPPYHDLNDHELDELASRITASRAQVVWIGLGTPRQDYLVPRLAERIDVVIIPVGAAFDFLSGRVKEAPKVLHGSGFEWLYRLIAEPRRLWRRYVLGNPRFLVAALRSRTTRPSQR